MTDFIEQDALTDTTYATPPIRDHPQEEVKSIIRTPRMDQTMLQKVRSWLSGDTPLDAPLVLKSADDGLRYMFLITSNSYQDRDGETITSEALKAYEASCYPGEDMFVCDNPFLWWHDDDVVIGEIVAVEYVEPFLVEMAKEIDDPIAKIIWDFAEANGDRAGTSHRFGYLEKDRDPDGTFHRIFKQETSYLPERNLAANDKTYAGVLKPMSIPESRKRLAAMVGDATGQDLSDLIHTNLSEAKKKLTALGVAHKAFPPATKKPITETDVAAVDDAARDIEEDVKEDDVMDEMGEGKAGITRLMVLMNGMLNIFDEMLNNEASAQSERAGMMKAFDELRKTRMTEKSQDKVTIEMLMEKMKAIEARQIATEKRLDLAPRSAQHEIGPSDPELAKQMVAEAIDGAETAKKNMNIKNVPLWGDIDESKGW